MPAFPTLGAAKILPAKAKGAAGFAGIGGGLQGFLNSPPSFLSGGGLPGITGGDARSTAFSSSDGTVFSASPFIFGGSGAGIDQNGGVLKYAILGATVLLGLLIWRRR